MHQTKASDTTRRRKKNNNDEYAKLEFDKRLKETRKKAIEENVKLAKKTGNKLTQNVNEDGQLVGTGNVNTIEKSLSNVKEATMEEVEDALFKGDNLRTGKSSKADSPRTARKKMVDYYTQLDKEENDGENVDKLADHQVNLFQEDGDDSNKKE